MLFVHRQPIGGSSRNVRTYASIAAVLCGVCLSVTVGGKHHTVANNVSWITVLFGISAKLGNSGEVQRK